MFVKKGPKGIHGVANQTAVIVGTGILNNKLPHTSSMGLEKYRWSVL